jgi:hypothetical protein
MASVLTVCDRSILYSQELPTTSTMLVGCDNMCVLFSSEFQLWSLMPHQRYQGMQKYCIPGMIGVPPVLLYASLGFFAIGLIDWLWHLSRGIAIYVSVLCGLVFIFHVVTTSIPCFTTRSPFKTPLSHLVGNLWRGMRQRRRPKGLMELDERQDIDKHGDELDAKSLKWLIQHTQSEEVYRAALRAARAFRHQQSQASAPCPQESTPCAEKSTAV